MKIPLFNIATFFLSLILLTNCEQAEISQKNYPFVVMQEAISSDSSTTLTANVISLGDEPIISHGFVLSSKPIGLVVLRDHLYIEQDDLQLGQMKLEISNTTLRDIQYYVRPFLQTETQIIYGTDLSFTNQ